MYKDRSDLGKVWKQQLSRRRALISAASLAAVGGVALVAGCGDDSDEGGGGITIKDSSGLLGTVSDTTRQAKRGGILPYYVNSDSPTLDPLLGDSFRGASEAIYVYSRLVKGKLGTRDRLPDGSVEGDAAASWEVASDGLQVTFKLRDDVTFDSRAPTNGRKLTSQDVKFSFDKLAATGYGRRDLMTSANPDAPVTGVETPDARTVVVKLKYPFAPLMEFLGSYLYLLIQPTEADGGFDPRADMRGSGAWTLSRYDRSSRFEYRRNPNWYIKDRPFLDGVDRPIITEYSQGLAQLRAGNLYSYAVRAEDVIPTKKDVSGLQMLADDNFSITGPRWIYFSSRPDSPFRDDRVRQAVSMLIDRDTLIDLQYNVSGYAEEGLEVPTRHYSHLSVSFPYWSDPKANQLGEGSKNFAYNPAEAKRLLSAAGHTGLESKYTYLAGTQYGSLFLQQCQIIQGMLTENGDFNLRPNLADYSTDYIPNYNRARGEFDGMGLSVSSGLSADGFLFSYYHSSGTFHFSGFKDSQLDSLIDQQRREFDSEKRASLIREAQSLMATKMYTVPWAGQALGFNLSWPWISNRFHVSPPGGGEPQESMTYYWYDESKKTS